MRPDAAEMNVGIFMICVLVCVSDNCKTQQDAIWFAANCMRRIAGQNRERILAETNWALDQKPEAA
jgi:hypothetical protein